MGLKLVLDPLDALEIFYRGEKLGIWEGELIRNEKRRGVFLPSLLKEFLLRYGLFNVNRGINQIWLPDKIDTDLAKVDGEKRDILILGKFRDDLVAVLADECDQENPTLLLDELPEEENGEVTLVFNKSDLDLKEFLTTMIIESPSVYDNAKFYNDDSGIQEAMDEFDEESRKELKRKIEESERPKRFLYWNEEGQQFVAVILRKDCTILLKFAPCLAIAELENLFNREFYENAENCNYERALNILLRLINYWTQMNNMDVTLAEKYKLAGRCCWMLKRWTEAEHYYKQAEQLYKDALIEALDKSAAFYEGLGNFYLAREDIFKSQTAFLEVDRLCELAGRNGPRNKGERIMRQGQIMMEAMRYEEAIDLYNKALAEFQKDPRDCKYDIARCQQLRGEARKKLNEKQENSKAETE